MSKFKKLQDKELIIKNCLHVHILATEKRKVKPLRKPYTIEKYSKENQDLCSKTYKILLIEIKEGGNK